MAGLVHFARLTIDFSKLDFSRYSSSSGYMELMWFRVRGQFEVGATSGKRERERGGEREGKWL